jgi:hypothetical protein
MLPNCSCGLTYPLSNEPMYSWRKEGKRVWRRLILLRSLVHWQSERHTWSWRKIERQWGSSDTYWKYQWEFAIDTLLVNIIEGCQKC